MRTIVLFLIIVTFLSFQYGAKGQFDKEFKRKLKANSENCANQNRVSQASVLTLFLGDEDHRPSQCYIFCMLHKYNLVSEDGTPNENNFKKYMKNVPEGSFKWSMEKNMPICLKEGGTDECKRAFNVVNCFYKNTITVNNWSSWSTESSFNS